MPILLDFTASFLQPRKKEAYHFFFQIEKEMYTLSAFTLYFNMWSYFYCIAENPKGITI